MLDWELTISERMSGLKLCAEARADIVRELGCHFEEIYTDARESGADDAEARDKALSSVRDWKRFARDVKSEKENFMTMTPFKRKVVMPGMVALVISGIALWVTSMLYRSGAQYVFHPIDPPRYFTINIPWLIALPLVGAIGAWMSWRNGGSASERFRAGIFPTLTFAWVPVWGAMVAVIWLVLNAIVPSKIGDHAGVLEWTMRIVAFLVPWVLLPAISMAVGTLPIVFLKPHAHAEEKHPAQAHA